MINPVFLAIGGYCVFLFRSPQHSLRLPAVIGATLFVNGVLFFGIYGTLSYGYTYRRLQGHITDAQNEILDRDLDAWLDKDRAARRHLMMSIRSWDMLPEHLKPYLYLFLLGGPGVWLLAVLASRWSPWFLVGIPCCVLHAWLATLVRDRYCERLDPPATPATQVDAQPPLPEPEPGFGQPT